MSTAAATMPFDIRHHATGPRCLRRGDIADAVALLFCVVAIMVWGCI